MLQPDQRLFEADLLCPDFRSGAIKGRWGVAEADVMPVGLTWPNVILWMKALSRPNSPDRFYVALDCAGYRAASPTGTFWDPIAKETLAFAKRPKGKPNSRFAKVFRTDWKNGEAFYHPYDRIAAKGHEKWAREQPHLVWDSNHTIVDYLEEFHALLQSGDYLGV